MLGCYRNPDQMETFAQAREFVENPRFERDRENILANLVLENVDSPIRELVAGMSALPYCFTIQCCYGHFVCSANQAPDNLEPVPVNAIGPVEYRIAYIALCLENSTHGRLFRAALEQIPVTDPDYIQFGSPQWFWKRYLNSFALQVEPLQFVNKDVATVECCEARYIQRVRDRFFAHLAELVQAHKTIPS